MTHVDSPLLAVEHICKSFPGVIALDGVKLDVAAGEIVAVIGENGAGKSTLMKILAGVQPPDRGVIRVAGEPVNFFGVRDALSQGIVLIHQELNLVSNLDIGGNIFLGREPTRNGLIDRAAIRDAASRELQKVGLTNSPDDPVSDLSIGHQQLVEIAKALSVGARILIMDEPTSSLSAREVKSLFQVIDNLRSQGVSILYISHHLDEVERLADRVVVLRDGRNVGTLKQDEIDRDKMVKMMVGRDVSRFYSRGAASPGEVALEVEGLSTSEFPQHRLSFCVRSGEVVGISGLVGAGRTELLLTLFGMQQPLDGQIRLNNQPCQFQSPRDAIDAGVALVPEDRKQQGLLLDMNVVENIGLPGLEYHRRLGAIVNQPYETENAATLVADLTIKTPSIWQTAKHLSGGNQQKIVIGKWLSLEPKLFLLDEPTRGIDIGSKEQVYRLIDHMAQQGVAVLFVSSELEEIIGISDRVIVMHEGRISGQLERDELCEEAIMQLATGSTER